MNDKTFVDSNLWLYAFVLRPGEESKHAIAGIRVENPVRYIVSEQVIAEVSANLLRKAGIEDASLDAPGRKFLPALPCGDARTRFAPPRSWFER